MKRFLFIVNISLFISLSACDPATNGIVYTNPYDMKGITYINFTVGREWISATESASWAPRCFHASVVLNNRIWIIGGETFVNEDYYLDNDVWYSSDGAVWEQAANAADWAARRSHTSIAFNDSIWVLGGNSGSSEAILLNDVWSSSDGAAWEQATGSADWSGRWGHCSIVFNDKIWVIGGEDDASLKNDVWSSSDGATWALVTDSAGWSARAWHCSVVYDNKIWITGGQDAASLKNDVWNSPDGITWTQVANSAGWSARYRHSSVVFDDKIIILGGTINIQGNEYIKNDVWFSINGSIFIKNTGSAEWPARSCHSSVVFNDKIWVSGGFDGDNPVSVNNDVWYSE